MPSVLVVARHGAYALELRRAGLVVLEAEDLDSAAAPELVACVIDAVGSDAPAPPAWERLEPMLAAHGAPPVVAVVSHRLPRWLEPLVPRAVLVSAPISGRVLVQHVTAAIGRFAESIRPAPARDGDLIDLALAPAQVIDLVEGMDREAAMGVRQPAMPVMPGPQRSAPAGVPATHDLSMPLRMARVDEVVDRLVECLPKVRSLRTLGEGLAATLAEHLAADVAVLVSRTPDSSWSVLAGSGLRSIEWRPVPRDPPVLALLDGRRPILRVESSDDVRQSVVGLPCASRQHLLIARYPTTDVLVTAGREDPSFTADDVRTLGRLLQCESGWDDALMMCRLAERMVPYLDS